MPTSARWEIANSPKIPAETVRSAGSMWASTPTSGAVKGNRVSANFNMFHKNRAVVARFFWLQHTLDRVTVAGIRVELAHTHGKEDHCYRGAALGVCCEVRQVVRNGKALAAVC